MQEIRTGLAGRAAPALLLLVIAGVHLNLYLGEEYNEIPTVGTLFLLTVISGVVLALAIVALPRLPIEVPAALFAAGVLGGYLLTLLLPQGLFLFKEPGISFSGYVSIAAEALTVVLSALLFVHRMKHHRFGLSTIPAH